MTTITLRARGSAPAELVWERYVCPARWASWSPQIRGVDFPGERLTVGVRGTVRGPLGVRVGFIVTALDERARDWTWRVGVGPARMTLRHEVLAERDGSSTTLQITGPAPLVIGYLAPARIALNRLVRAAPQAPR